MCWAQYNPVSFLQRVPELLNLVLLWAVTESRGFNAYAPVVAATIVHRLVSDDSQVHYTPVCLANSPAFSIL